MNSHIRRFDTAGATLVAKLPSIVRRPFVVTGVLASPAAWGMYTTLFLVTGYPDRSQLIALLILLPLATGIKLGFKRQRPPTIYAGTMRIKSYSFPSSHAYASALACIYIAGYAGSHGAALVAVIALLFAAKVTVSRVYLGAHYPSDVIAGAILGAVIALGIQSWA